MLQRAEVVAAEIAQAHLDAKLAQAEDEPDPPAEEELLFDVYAHPSPRLSSASPALPGFGLGLRVR